MRVSQKRDTPMWTPLCECVVMRHAWGTRGLVIQSCGKRDLGNQFVKRDIVYGKSDQPLCRRTLCLHTYTHTYIHTCMHAYIHTYIHAYIHTYVESRFDLPYTWLGCIYCTLGLSCHHSHRSVRFTTRMPSSSRPASSSIQYTYISFLYMISDIMHTHTHVHTYKRTHTHTHTHTHTPHQAKNMLILFLSSLV